MYFTIIDKFKLLKATSNNLLRAVFAKNGVFPPAIVWLLTYKCNATCRHCDFWKRDQATNEADIMSIAQKIASSNAFIVNLSGGEIFLIPNIREVVALLKNAGKYIRINSNGLVINDYLEFLLRQQVDSIAISIDSINPQQHDANRGKSGAFKKSLEAIAYIKKHRIGKKPEISVRSVFMKSNIDQIEDYIDFFADKVDSVFFQPIHDQVEKHKVVSSEVLFSAGDEPHVRKVVNKLASKYAFLNNSYFRNFPEFIFHPDRLSATSVNFCLPVLYNTLMIYPDGECYSCNHSIGNIKKEELGNVWSKPVRWSFLKKLACEGKCPAPCWLNSNSAQTAIAGSVAKLLIKIARQ